MRDEQKQSFEELCTLIEVPILTRWQSMAAYDENGNPNFVMPEPKDMSLRAQMKILMEAEDDDEVSSPASGAAEWIVEAISIQSVQSLPRRDIKDWGTRPTTKQALDTATRRKSLATRLDAHRVLAATFLVPLVPKQIPSVKDSDGLPEEALTLLPSDCRPSQLRIHKDSPIVESERALRRASCLKSLQRLRAVAIQQSRMSLYLNKHSKGTRSAARKSATAGCFEQRLAHACWQYTDSFERLSLLGMTPKDVRLFKKLSTTDIEALSRAVQSKRPLGEGRIKLTWYWRGDLSAEAGENGQVYAEVAKLGEEHEASLRVEWFRSRERYLRWEEEVFWLQRESASLVLAFNSKALRWLSKAHISTNKGWKAYCRRQYNTREDMTKTALMILQPILHTADGPGAQLCRRAREELAHLLPT